MTEQEYLALPDREKDALVAQQVFGFWKVAKDDRGEMWWGPHPATPGEAAHASCCLPGRIWGPDQWGDSLPKFSESTNAAWQIKAAVHNWVFSKRQSFLAALSETMRARLKVPVAWPDLLLFLEPTDLCIAALKAKGAIA